MMNNDSKIPMVQLNASLTKPSVRFRDVPIDAVDNTFSCYLKVIKFYQQLLDSNCFTVDEKQEILKALAKAYEYTQKEE